MQKLDKIPIRRTEAIANLLDLSEADFAAAEFTSVLIDRASKSRHRKIFDHKRLSELLDDYAQILIDPQRTEQYLKVIKEQQTIPPQAYCYRKRGKNGTEFWTVDTKRLAGLHDDGYTLVINRLEALNKNSRKLCDELSRAAGCRVQINLYSSNGASYGFAPHFDYHDLFAVQIHGSKQWTFSDKVEVQATIKTPAEPYPLPTTWKTPIILNEGDIAYVPCGTWHAVNGLNVATTHLTISLRYTTVLDYLSWILEHAKASEVLRRPLYVTERTRENLDRLIHDSIRAGLAELATIGYGAEEYFLEYTPDYG